MKYRSKKVWLNYDKSKFCMVRIYRSKVEMQFDYEKYSSDPERTHKIEGVHCSHTAYVWEDDSSVVEIGPSTGLIFLYVNGCQASIVAHEFGHAVFWAHKHDAEKANGNQYPFVIADITEEEEVLHCLSYAIQQFYKWYWKVAEEIKNTK